MLAQGRLKDFGPLLVIWGGAMLVLVETKDLGSALLFFGIFLAMLYVATARLLYVGDRRRALPRGRGRRLRARLARARARDDLAAPWTEQAVYCAANGQDGAAPELRELPAEKSLYSIANGGYAGTGLGKGTFTTTGGDALDPVPEHRLHLLGARAGARPDRRRRARPRLHALRRCAASGSRCSPSDGFSKLLAVGLTSASRCRPSSSSAGSCGSSR